MNTPQRKVLLAGAFVVLVLLGIGSWTFTTTELAEVRAPSSIITSDTIQLEGKSFLVDTWEGTSRCSILLGRPRPTFGVPTCDRYDAWREPFIVAVGAAAIMTSLAVLWCASPRPGAEDQDAADSDGADPDTPPIVHVSPSSEARSPRRSGGYPPTLGVRGRPPTEDVVFIPESVTWP